LEMLPNPAPVKSGVSGKVSAMGSRVLSKLAWTEEPLAMNSLPPRANGVSLHTRTGSPV
jgi:hypothetical protein